MISIRSYFPVIAFAVCAVCGWQGPGKAEAARFRPNLSLGTRVDAGTGKVRITKISESLKTPINGVAPKAAGNKFVVIETLVMTVPSGSSLSSAGFVLATRSGQRYDGPGAYGKVTLFDKPSNFEATDGAVVYAGNAGDPLNVFFEIPGNTDIKGLQLIYSPPAEKK